MAQAPQVKMLLWRHYKNKRRQHQTINPMHTITSVTAGYFFDYLINDQELRYV